MTLQDRLAYYIELLSTLCGFDTPQEISMVSMIVVFIAFLIVCWAFYLTIIYTLWPGETDSNHCKYDILSNDKEVWERHED